MLRGNKIQYNFAVLLIITCLITSMHIFLQFVEGMGMFLCNKYNSYQCIVISSNVFISLELHCLVVSVDHIFHI